MMDYLQGFDSYGFWKILWLDTTCTWFIILIGIHFDMKIFWKASKLARFYLWKPKILIVWGNKIDGLSPPIFQRLKITLIDSVQWVDWKNSFGKCQRLWRHKWVFKDDFPVVRRSAWKKNFKVWISIVPCSFIHRAQSCIQNRETHSETLWEISRDSSLRKSKITSCKISFDS